MDSKKLVLDSNIINYCLELELENDFFSSIGCQVWIPTHVKNEILNSQNNDLINKLEEIEFRETGFFGFSDDPNALGFGDKFDSEVGGIMYSSEYDIFVKNTHDKNFNDRFIAILAEINNATFITADKIAFRDSVKHKIPSIFITKDEKAKLWAEKFSSFVYHREYWTKEYFKKALLQKMFV